MKLQDILDDKRQLSVRVGHEELTVVYRPSGLTPAVEFRLSELQGSSLYGAALAEALSAVLVSWDLESDDGKPYPTERAALNDLPTVFLSQVFSAIVEDMTANPTVPAARSNATLRQRAQ